jgi:hypothetical protein
MTHKQFSAKGGKAGTGDARDLTRPDNTDSDNVGWLDRFVRSRAGKRPKRNLLDFVKRLGIIKP